ncbi:DUF6779 domain-containing protein [Corynebacterium sp. HMSC034A01]|uniref:DUF6779 domain-containing protein n=1 Tax=Corynebacterium sp. HMSC034A01 TaxID=1739295 RepID=UPI0008A97FE2|nr:DUF6779 domain-containing protein [Corynebacterium sp. HMSC034A01]OHR24146.1 hypothetical protein HMPREF2791_04875 [Corynebacterium sp. HMSC034A01]
MSAQNASPDRASLWVIVPFVVAVIGTVVMLFTNSANALKVALIFALWAGAAGILINSKVRRDRDAATAEAAAAEQRIQEQEQRHREALESNPASSVDVETLRELQEQIQALRAQLEELNGRVFEYEPAAVQARARRISELESRPEPKPEPTPEPAPEPKPQPAHSPSTDDTVVISRVRPSRPTGAPSSDAIAGRIGTQPSARPARNPLSDLISEREAEKAKSEQTPEPQPERRPGRRRADERGENAVSVAELLARRGK